MAFGPSYPASRHVALHLSALTAKVDQVAARAGVSASDRLSLETALAALPWSERRRLGLVLESARVGAQSEFLRTAVEMVLERAAKVWATTPPPDQRGE
jgi:hypothetical protein